MEELPMPEWKIAEDNIFSRVEASGALGLCVEEILAQLVEDENLIARLADEALKSPEARELLAEVWKADEGGSEADGPRDNWESPDSSPKHPDALYSKLVDMLDEELWQVVSSHVWSQLDPDQGHPPAAFLSACVKDAVGRYYAGRALFPDLKHVPAVMVEEGGVSDLSEVAEEIFVEEGVEKEVDELGIDWEREPASEGESQDGSGLTTGGVAGSEAMDDGYYDDDDEEEEEEEEDVDVVSEMLPSTASNERTDIAHEQEADEERGEIGNAVDASVDELPGVRPAMNDRDQTEMGSDAADHIQQDGDGVIGPGPGPENANRVEEAGGRNVGSDGGNGV